MFDVTLTDEEFQKEFVNKNEEWLQAGRGAEPDLEVEGLSQTLIARLLRMIGLG